MILKLQEIMRRLKVDERTFFRMAHLYLFGTDPDLTQDVQNFKQKAIVPVYVVRYVETLPMPQ